MLSVKPKIGGKMLDISNCESKQDIRRVLQIFFLERGIPLRNNMLEFKSDCETKQQVYSRVKKLYSCNNNCERLSCETCIY